MNKLTTQQLENLLTEDERRYAEMTVANEFTPADRRRTNKEIAEELGVTDRTLRNWKQKPIVAEYIIHLTNAEKSSFYPTAISQLHKAIKGGNNGQPSVKALELFLRSGGFLTDQKHVITETIQHAPLTRKEVSEQLTQLDDIINGD